MATDTANTMIDTAVSLLGVDPSATDEQLRTAYLQQVRLHPPDHDPDLFERIRDAYDLLRDPSTRALQVLQTPRVLPLSKLLEGIPSGRRYVGSAPWLAVLKENREQ